MFTQLRPILFAEDLPAEVDFYRKLGFQILFEMPGMTGLTYGEAILFGLQQRPGARFADEQPLVWQIATDDIDAVHQTCRQEGFSILEEPEQQAWGDWIFSARTPNGYRLVFEGSKR